MVDEGKPHRANAVSNPAAYLYAAGIAFNVEEFPARSPWQRRAESQLWSDKKTRSILIEIPGTEDKPFDDQVDAILAFVAKERAEIERLVASSGVSQAGINIAVEFLGSSAVYPLELTPKLLDELHRHGMRCQIHVIAESAIAK